MKKYVIADDTGEIIGSGHCAEQDMPQNAIEGDGSHLTHYVADGQIVAYTQSEVEAKANRPAFVARWSNEHMAWVDVRNIDELRQAKNAEINAARLAANRGTFTFAGRSISCDELARSDIDGVNGFVVLNGQLPPGWVGGWKAIDNSFVEINDVPTWCAFYTAMIAQGQANFAHAQALKAQLAQAASFDEIELIAW